MCLLKYAKIFLCVAVLLFFAKPLLAFSMFNRVHPPSAENIFVKAFDKRKQEYTENSNYDIVAIQKKLANPDKLLFLRFSLLLSILFPLFLSSETDVTNRLLCSIKLHLSPPWPAYLVNRQLII